MKTIRIILVLFPLVASGCKALKDAAPSGYEVMWSEPVGNDKSGRQLSFGLTGALPFGKQ